MTRTTTTELDNAWIEWDGWTPTLVVEEYGKECIVKRTRITFSDPGMMGHLVTKLRSVVDVLREKAAIP